jgi:hypothetical protein
MTDVPLACIELAVGTLHAAGTEDRVARCGRIMGNPWISGPIPVVAERAARLCHSCFPEWAQW